MFRPSRKGSPVLRRLSGTTLVCLLAVGALHAADPVLDSEDKKTLYALGVALSQRLTSFELTAEETSIIQAGLGDGVLGREPKVALAEYGPQIDEYLKSRLQGLTERKKAAGKAFRDEAAKAAGATVTDSGLIYVEQETGRGAKPSDSATVTVHYHGTFPDGRVFDSSRDSGEPATFALNGVVACFSEGIQLMRVGGKSKLICAPDLAYGDAGYAPMIPPGSTLVFEVELLDVADVPAPPTP